MQLPIHTCSFKGGMNKDISPNEYPNTCYFDLTNLRLIVDNSGGLATASLSTPKGNAASFTLPTNMVLMGYTVLRDYLIILAHDTVSATDPDKIYRIPISSLTTAGNLTIDGQYYWTGADRHLVYEADLNFNTSYPIRVVANYENEDVQKIYWADGLNTLKHLNTIYNASYNDLSSLDSELLEILPNHTYGSYTLTESVGGHLRAGRIQYSYQLYSISGTETMFAPPCNLWNITSYLSADGEDFVGNDIETVVNKSITVVVTLSTGEIDRFNRIRLVALEYEEYNDIPTVRVVAEHELSSTTTTFLDVGNSIGEFTLEQFQEVKNDFIPYTIESKNNYLFASNISEELFDVDDMVESLSLPGKTFLDTRAYRWRYALATGTAYGSKALTVLSDPSVITISGKDGYQLASGNASLLAMTESEWSIRIIVGAEAHAAAQIPPRTVTSVGINSTRIYMWLYHPDHGWCDTLVLTNIDLGAVTYHGTITNDIHLTGSGYYEDWGLDGLTHPRSEYTALLITEFNYKYNYSYTTLANSYECVLNKSLDGEFILDDGTGPVYDLVDENHDCINVYNNILNDESNRDSEYKYKYGIVGAPTTVADLGGTGHYISFGFISPTGLPAGDIVTEGAGDETLYKIVPSSSSPGYTSQINVSLYTGYQRDEIYRFGIVFYDLKGRPSYTKWISDIRMPDICEEFYDGASTYSDSFEFASTVGGIATTTIAMKPLGVTFSIDWDHINTDYPGLLTQLSGFQIVRVKRSDSDCTVKANGIIVPTHHPTVATGSIKDTNYSSYNITSAKDYEDNSVTQITNVTGTNSGMDKTLVELLSPEIAVNKNIITDSSDFLEVIGYIDQISKGGTFAGTTNTHTYSVAATKVNALQPTPTLTGTDWRKQIDDSIVSTPVGRTPTTNTIDTTEYTARGFNDDAHGGDPEMTYKSTTLVAKIESAFSSVTSGGANGEEKAMYGRYRRYLGYSIYGGASYENRSYNTYIKAGEFYPIPTLPVGGVSNYNIYGGDIYIGPFAFLKLFVDTDPEYDHSGQVLVTFPVESRLNLSHRLDAINRYVTIPTNETYFLAEKQSTGVSQYPDGYPEIGDLYRYNSAYSAENVSKEFIAKPFDFRSTKVRDVVVTSSEPKINGEYSDSWLKFKYNNYIELEGEFGAVTRLINHNERLFAFQPRGIAALSVLERELVETNNTQTLAVGTGGILSRYDYISKSVGTSLYDAICPTELGIYFYSDKLNAIYRIVEGLEPLSDTKGMKSYFESTPWTTCKTAYDKANREILFTPNSGDTLVFSGYMDAFQGFFSLGAINKYITFDKYLISSLNGNAAYLHNVGDYNRYFGTYQTSDITLIVNPAKTNVVTFHVAEWMTDLTLQSSGAELENYTFDELQITNSYQDTDNIDLSNNQYLSKRFRKWRLNVLRDGDDSRIRDSWIKAIFTWNQTYPLKKLIVHPFNFMYLPTKLY